MASASEARFRVQAPNSKPRAIKVVSLDPASDEVVKRLAAGPWTNATFFTASARRGDGEPLAFDRWLTDLAGEPRDIKQEVDTADLVVMVATPGGGAHMASLIGEACSNKRVMTTSLVVGAENASEDEVSKTLAQVRPWSLMVVIANPDDYIDDMLVALRAA
jgi:hypothetical protein